MQTEKKTFTKAEVEVIKFDKNNDIITTSTSCTCDGVFTILVGGEPVQGCPLDEEDGF